MSSCLQLETGFCVVQFFKFKVLAVWSYSPSSANTLCVYISSVSLLKRINNEQDFSISLSFVGPSANARDTAPLELEEQAALFLLCAIKQSLIVLKRIPAHLLCLTLPNVLFVFVIDKINGRVVY